MPKISALLDGATIKIPVMGIPRPFKKVAYNHYKQGEVVLMGNGKDIFDNLDLRSRATSNGVGGIQLYAPGAPYPGGFLDHRLEFEFTSMLDPLLQGSLTPVTLQMLTVSSWNQTTGSQKTQMEGYPVSSTIYNVDTFDTAGYKYEINWDYITIKRRAFCFSAREWMNWTIQPITTDTYYGSDIHWVSQYSSVDGEKAQMYFQLPGTSLSDSPITYLYQNRFTLLDEYSPDPLHNPQRKHFRNIPMFRNAGFVKGTYGGTSQTGNARLAVMPFLIGNKISIKTTAATSTAQDSIIWINDHCLTSTNNSADDNTVYTPRYSNVFALTVNGNLEVSAADNAVITGYMGVNAYRKLNGAWRKIVG